ncbi:unnamed protein product, partial [Mesorhabditis belari]|uniref:Galectin n=1 Tax=Mesorhabditis belari TaxID=2138241 RepID=A0AAF3FPA3_9BILA
MHQRHNVPVPFVEPFYEPVMPGVKIELDGCLHHGHHKTFVVELLSGPHHVFHMSFRFAHHEHKLVMNSSVNGSWQCEERVHNPIGHHDSKFHLCVHVHASHFDVHVNGRCVATFRHRYPIETIQALGVHGDLHVDKLHFTGFPFRSAWGMPGYNWGHQGYMGYGTPQYVAPQFHPTHHHHHHWRKHY